MGALTAMLLSGVLLTTQGGREIGRERFRDDGRQLVSELTLGGQEARVTVTRSPRTVVVEAGGQRIERAVSDDTVPLENGQWQAYALVAEWFPDAVAPRRVKLLVPAQGAMLDATVQVRPRAGGGKVVEVHAGPLLVEAEVDPGGRVVAARVPAQLVTVRALDDTGAATEASAEAKAPRVEPSARLPLPGITEEAVKFESRGARLEGVIFWPRSLPSRTRAPLVVMVAGSGPTDRDGNNPLGVKADSYRLLAQALAARGIASLRYDKRGTGTSSAGVAAESDLTFDHFVDDAEAAVALAVRNPRAGRVTLLGHSEGGLIALRLLTRDARGPRPAALVLVAAAGRPFAEVLVEQLQGKIPKADLPALDKVIAAVAGGTVPATVPPSLAPIFRPGAMPFLRGVLKLDPAPLLKRVGVPVTIVQGETDAQVGVADARRLAAAQQSAKLVLLPRVNHVLKEESTRALPQLSYADPDRPLGPGVVDAIAAAVVR